MESFNPYTNKAYSDQYYQLLTSRKRLPVYKKKDEIISVIRDNPIVIIEGHTGSGKTTQIPQFILESGIVSPDKQIVCTQPRRISAITVAKRVSEEMDVGIGNVVGYAVRFDSKSSDDSRLIYMTDGLLMREFIMDPLIKKFGIVIIDEAHERTTNSDIIMGLLSKILYHRIDDLKIVIMSATLDAEKFVKFFSRGDIIPPHLIVQGSLFNVTVSYEESTVVNEIDQAIRKTMDIHLNKPEGDILVFMTGEEEIESTCSTLRDQVSALRSRNISKPAEILPLYASLQSKEQQKVFQPPEDQNARKIIVSTNIAETSVTIDGIVYVIDVGYVKQNRYNPKYHRSILERVFISKAAADQRKGRAGRTREGFCYRLYTKRHFEEEMLEQTIPGIQRENLTSVVLTMLACNERDLVHFPFLDPPHYKLIISALEELYHLNALTLASGNILTDIGSYLSKIPVDPNLGKSLLSSIKYDCLSEVCSIVALVSEQGFLFVRPRSKAAAANEAHKQFLHPTGDHLSMLNVMTKSEEGRYRGNLKVWCDRNFVDFRVLDSANHSKNQLYFILNSLKEKYQIKPIPDDSPIEDRILKSLSEGLFMQTAFYDSSLMKYRPILNNIPAEFHHLSMLNSSQKPDWVIYQDFVSTKGDILRTCSIINPEWLLKIAPEFFYYDNFDSEPIRSTLFKLQNPQ